MRLVFFHLEGDRPQGALESEFFLLSCPPSIPLEPTSFTISTLSLAWPSLLEPHLPLTPPYHISHFELDHSCTMEMSEKLPS